MLRGFEKKRKSLVGGGGSGPFIVSAKIQLSKVPRY